MRSKLLLAATALLVSSGRAQTAIPVKSVGLPGRMYVFGDSYSDIGEGYLDGNGPTAVAYLAKRLGLELYPSTTADVRDKSLDYAVSGAQSGLGAGHRIKGELLGYGMRNQVDDFAARVRSNEITFDPTKTLFFLAGGLNDGKLPDVTTAANEEEEVRILYGLGARHFVVALLTTEIPGFAVTGRKINPSLRRIPAALREELPGAEVRLSRWGMFFDVVLAHPEPYGISNTTDACAGRAIFDEDTTPCAKPESYFYYHHGHPSTATHKAVGDMLYEEMTGKYAHSGDDIPGRDTAKCIEHTLPSLTPRCLMSVPHFPVPSECSLLLIDIQPVILENSKTSPAKTVKLAASTAIKIAHLLEMPVFVSLIPTSEKAPEPVDELAGQQQYTRHFAGSFNQPEIREAVAATGRKVLAIGGIVSEIAVLQAGLTAIREGYTVHVLVDCCGGLTERTEVAAFRQLETAGAVLSSVASFFTSISGDFSTPTSAETLKTLQMLMAKE